MPTQRRQYNTRCVTYRSQKLAEAVRAHFTASIQPATTTGTGSVAPSGSVPVAYTVASCAQHGAPMGTISLLGGLTAGVGYIPPYTPKLGTTHRWCTQCAQWVLLPGHHRYVPKPPAAKLTVTQQAAQAAGAQVHGSKPVYTHGPHLTPTSGLVGSKYTKR